MEILAGRLVWPEVRQHQENVKKLHKRLEILVGINPANHNLAPTANMYEPLQNIQMTLLTLRSTPQTHAVTWDPRSMEDPPREIQYHCAQASAGILHRGHQLPAS